MTTQTATPLTDAALSEFLDTDYYVPLKILARRLERDHADLIAALERCITAIMEQDTRIYSIAEEARATLARVRG